MTITRQYSLPNCKLILQGLSGETDNPADRRPSLSMLMSAECHFVGYPDPIVGGREFFECLVGRVSQYAQEFLSGVSAPEPDAAGASLVELRRVESDRHRLTVRPNGPGEQGAGAEPANPIQLDLTTVQLFDLVEAVDQFFADSRTLPNLSVQLKPVPRRHVKPEKPVAERIAPAAVGVSGLAIAALALFAVPVPELRRPLEPNPQESAETAPEAEPASGQSAPPEPATDLESNLTPAPAIGDPEEIADLRQQLFEEINQAWRGPVTFDRSLIYRVSVGRDGKILAYEGINEITPEEEEQIPLSELEYRGVGTESAEEPRADFEVVFDPNEGGIVEVNPWSESPEAVVELETEAASPLEVANWREQLQARLEDIWTPEVYSQFEEELTYRVDVDGEGMAIAFEPQTPTSETAIAQTPLSELQPAPDGMSDDSEPAQTFEVILTPAGEIQVNPLPTAAPGE
ncbi:MAG: DUF4335 domain-containing protein [Limnospira sp.]